MNKSPATMRVLMTADTIGGIWTYCIELIRALAAHGVEVHLATMGAPATTAQRDQLRALNVALYESTYRLEWMRDPWDDVEAAADWLLRLEVACQPDVIHLNGYVHAALPWQAPVLVVGHSCVVSWFHAVRKTQPPSGEWGRYREAVRNGLAGADAVTAPSASMLQSLQDNYGDISDLRGPIYNARCPSLFRPREKFPLIVSAGRVWDEAKGIDSLDRVAPRLRWPVEVAGDAVYPDDERERRTHRIKTLGHLAPSQFANRLASASVFALPARYEPFGLSALEAGLSGCALVLGDIPSLREIWGDAAWYVTPGDDDELAQALERLIERPRLARELGQKARNRALGYAPERMALNYVSLYNELLRRKRKRIGRPQNFMPFAS